MKEKKVRQLAAVMFADIVGYTALMQSDEQVASNVRARHREVFLQQHKLHQGKIIQYYGDGVLSVFKSAIEAATCAIEIQKLLQEGYPVPLRIGIHLGDIVFDKTEVYGDGVNFASRIESMGVAGAILLSGKLNDELKNHHHISTISLGHFELKNVVGPVEVFAVTNEGIKVPMATELKGKQTIKNKTIAVLPFVNMSNSKENEYFSDGITEEIITALSRIKSLRVTSRTSSFFFKNKNIPVKQIGTELNVSTILEGSVRLSGDTVRITAQLIQAEKDFHFWSQTWDRKLENIFEIQDEISLLIAEKLREQFGHFEIQDHLVDKQTNNIHAYEYSLKAKFHANKWNPEDKRIAISLYEKALELDANHTESYLGLADCYGFMATIGFMPYEEAWGKSAQLTNKALLLNDQLPGVHYQLSYISFFTACDYRESFKQTTKAIELKPNYVEAQQFMSFLYIIAGEKEKSHEHLEIALCIDPLSQETLFFSAYFSYMLEDYTSSLEQLDRCLQHNPKNLPAHTVKCYCLLKLGRWNEVINYFDTMPSGILVLGDKLGLTGLAYAVKKDASNTAKYLDLLLEHVKSPDGFRAHSYLFLMYAVTGQKDEAFEWISRAIENKSSLLLFNFADPLVNSIKNDPRYLAFHKIIYQNDLIIDHPRKKKELLDAGAVKTYSARLMNYINEEKPYLDPNLSLRSLAMQINIHPNQLSWLLNESIGKNFNDFINHYRVDAFKKLSKDPKNAHLTLMGLAFDSGFNSKTVFNTSFKKETGLTPKQFSKTLEM
jgi:TolB-like protein/class 3 adenylate cyclase/AraC-like DNA-binding protein